jgi:hypothetical protein
MRTATLPSKFFIGHLPPERLHEAFHIERSGFFVIQLAHHRDLPVRSQRKVSASYPASYPGGSALEGLGGAGLRIARQHAGEDCGGIPAHHVADDHARWIQHSYLHPEVADCKAASVDKGSGGLARRRESQWP